MSRRLLDYFAAGCGPPALDRLKTPIGRSFGHSNFLQLPNSISWTRSLRRVISALPPDEFEAGFQRWTAAASNNNKEVYHQMYAAFILLYQNAIVFPTRQVFDFRLTAW